MREKPTFAWEGTQRALEAGLYVVATPIGNLEDVTLRSLIVLASCDSILCEDTRISRRLLDRYDIRARAPLLRYDDHSDERTREKICARVQNGGSVALVCDSGTPALSDPGMKLVRACRRSGLSVFSVPGASSLSAALSIAGLPSDRALFAGFPPPTHAKRRAFFASLAEVQATLVLFESPHRLLRSLESMAQAFPARRACILREMTKKFESHYEGTLEALATRLGNKPPRGEYTVVIEPPCKKASPKRLGERP